MTDGTPVTTPKELRLAHIGFIDKLRTHSAIDEKEGVDILVKMLKCDELFETGLRKQMAELRTAIKKLRQPDNAIDILLINDVLDEFEAKILGANAVVVESKITTFGGIRVRLEQYRNKPNTTRGENALLDTILADIDELESSKREQMGNLKKAIQRHLTSHHALIPMRTPEWYSFNELTKKILELVIDFEAKVL